MADLLDRLHAHICFRSRFYWPRDHDAREFLHGLFLPKQLNILLCLAKRGHLAAYEKLVFKFSDSKLVNRNNSCDFIDVEF